MDKVLSELIGYIYQLAWLTNQGFRIPGTEDQIAMR